MTTKTLNELVDQYRHEFNSATIETREGNRYVRSMDQYQLMALVIAMDHAFRELADSFERMEGELMDRRAIDREKWVTSR